MRFSYAFFCFVFFVFSQNDNSLTKATPYNFSVRVADIIYYDMNPVHVDERGNVRVEFYLSIMNDVVTYNKLETSGIHQADLKIDLSVYSENEEFLHRHLWDRKVSFSSDEFESKQKDYTQFQEDFFLSAGNYHIRISVLDGHSNRSKVFESDLHITDVGSAKQFLTEPKFFSGSNYLSNQAVLDFNLPHTVGFFYKSDSKLNLELQVLQNNRIELSVREELTATDRISKMFIKLPTEALREGNYTLQVVVNNRVVQKTNFEVLWWKKPTMLHELEFAFRPFRILLNEQELAEFEALSLTQKRNYFASFWSSRAKTGANGYNPLLEEFYRRVDVALKKYTKRKTLGYKTDLGKTYILHGAPIREERMLVRRKQVLVWFYESFRAYFTYDESKNSYLLSEKLGENE